MLAGQPPQVKQSWIGLFSSGTFTCSWGINGPGCSQNAEPGLLEFWLLLYRHDALCGDGTQQVTLNFSYCWRRVHTLRLCQCNLLYM